MCDEPELYHGPFVVLAPDPLGYRVSIDPPPPGDDPARTFAEKHDAWGYASHWWRRLHCPLRDLTDHNTARADHDLENNRVPSGPPAADEKVRGRGDDQ